MKLQGKEFSPRRANHKWFQLDDLDNLYKLLLEKCQSDVAKELGVPQNSIRYRFEKYFPEEWKENINRKRKPHTKNRPKQTD